MAITARQRLRSPHSAFRSLQNRATLLLMGGGGCPNDQSRIKGDPPSNQENSVLTPMEGRSPFLDAARGIAALGVFIDHVFSNGLLSPAAAEPYRYLHYVGSYGVDLFYVLSGFFITNAVLRPATWDAGRFWRARVTRIYPAYLVSIVFSIAVKVYATHYRFDANQFAVVLLHLLMLHHLVYGVGGAVNGTYWTLGVEFPYYLLMLALAPFLRNTKNILKLLGFLIICSVLWKHCLFTLLIHTQDPGIINFAVNQLPGALEMFAGGGIVAVLCNRSLRLSSLVRGFLAVCSAVGFVLLMAYYLRHASHFWVYWPSVVIFRTALAVVFATMVYLLATLPSVPWLAATPLPWLGKISFSFYLYHSICILLVVAILPAAPAPVRVLAATALSLAISWASWRLVETRFHRFSVQMTKRNGDARKL